VTSSDASGVRSARPRPVRSATPPPDFATAIRAEGAPEPGDVLPSHYRWCIGCGADHPGGLHMRMVAGPGLSAHSELLVSEYHQGAPGLAHGGVMSTAMDEAMGVLNRLLRVPAVTARLEVDYRRPVPVGCTLHIASSIVAHDRRKVYTEAVARLDAADGPVAITAAALFLQVSLQHFADHGNPEHLAVAIEDRNRGGPTWEYEVNP